MADLRVSNAVRHLLDFYGYFVEGRLFVRGKPIRAQRTGNR